MGLLPSIDDIKGHIIKELDTDQNFRKAFRYVLDKHKERDK